MNAEGLVHANTPGQRDHTRYHERRRSTMPDLTTTYLGLHLSNPLVASASPLSRSLDSVRRLEDAGAAAIVMYSLFEEQITHESLELDHYLHVGTHSYAESLSYFPDLDTYNLGPERYLEYLNRVKASVHIPVIGSLNGVTSGGWTEYARKIEEAGADALELNIYFLSADPNVSSADLETSYRDLVSDICDQVTIPVAVKLTPFFTSLPHFAGRLVQAGASGLVLFNRFYQPDFDLEAFEVVPKLHLSSSRDLLLPLRWVALLYGRVRADLALTSGAHTAEDVLKATMAGASVVMFASELLAHGPRRLTDILGDLNDWMEEHEYESIAQMRGSMSQGAVADPSAFERANYMKVLNSFRHLA
jgi:dihydroorotate dehydrogenase (fumarate)